jgi:ABC-type uncharacterized transport system auxiliary subunit
MRTRMRRFRWGDAVVVTAALMLAGCGAVRYPASYLLDLEPTRPQAESPRGGLGQLVVREFQCPAYLCDGRIVYRPTRNEVGFYEFHRWATSPRQMISQSVAATIRARGLFTSVTLRDGATGPAYLLTGVIERLEEVDSGRDVHAVCALSAQLVDARTKSVIWTRAESATVAVVERSVAGVVSSLTTATRTAVEALVASMEKQLLPPAGR